MLVSNTVDVSRGVEVVGEDAQPAVSQVGGSESDTISVRASVGEAEVSETVVGRVPDRICSNADEASWKHLQVWIQWI